MTAIGDTASRVTTVSAEDVEVFTRLTGDDNPIHRDAEFAKLSRFGQRIAPGMYVGSLIGAVLANELPGPGTIYLEQSLRFLAPVHFGDRIEARVVVESLPEPGRALLRTSCVNQHGVAVIEGIALMLLPVSPASST